MPLRLRLTLPAFALAALLAGVGPAAAESGGEKPNLDHVDRMAAAPAPSVGERAARIALKAVGTPYRWGGESPASGFDCSGLVRWAYGRLGIDLPHSSYALYDVGRRVARAEIEPGDVLFFEGLGHVGLYLGAERMVHAPETGREVEVVRLTRSSYAVRLVGARRVAPA
jgi:cell wall-associated NlpC family hydrolase